MVNIKKSVKGAIEQYKKDRAVTKKQNLTIRNIEKKALFEARKKEAKILAEQKVTIQRKAMANKFKKRFEVKAPTKAPSLSGSVNSMFNRESPISQSIGVRRKRTKKRTKSKPKTNLIQPKYNIFDSSL